MKLVSIDLETTGIEVNEDQIIQIGAVGFDTNSEFKPIFYRKYVFNNSKIIGSPFALHMNANKILLGDIFGKLNNKYIKKSKRLREEFENSKISMSDILDFNKENDILKRLTDDVVNDNELSIDFNLWIKSNNLSIEEGKSTINIIGKNAAGFDLRFIERYNSDESPIRWKRRVMDIGNLYATKEDEVIPDLTEVLKRSGIENPTVVHDALFDAMDVALTTYKYYNPEFDIVEERKIFEDYFKNLLEIENEFKSYKLK